MNFGRRPSQNPQKLTLAALKFGVGNVKNRRFQLGLVRFLPGFYRNIHREPLNTTTKGFGLEPERSTGLVFGLKSDSRQYQLVPLLLKSHIWEFGPEPRRRPQHARELKATRDTRGCLRGRDTRMLGSGPADEWRMYRRMFLEREFFF